MKCLSCYLMKMKRDQRITIEGKNFLRTSFSLKVLAIPIRLTKIGGASPTFPLHDCNESLLTPKGDVPWSIGKVV